MGAAALFGATLLVAAMTHDEVMTPAAQAQVFEQAPDLKALIDEVESRHGGKVLGIEREDDGQQGLYEVEFLGVDGRESEFDVNRAGNKVSVHDERHPHKD
ncbi:PepSY domain-containing protein [Nitrococcus mobilis]|uniref:PepSY domain-containing protein n=1 Tax=Nitrococcus mobilis Nb-231 TaxID=314278 RepID=A4BNI6_9GAMM|nr:PepSY domain-containing protein [Nitrococcus mobilis]EAR22785.1 hypothetical protein NB231_10043 [Nitrococcus mobilis Nb-231]